MGNEKSKGGGGGAPKAKTAAVSKTVDQISQLKGTLQRLEQRRDFLEKKVTQELVNAKSKNKKGDKRGAVAHLKRKKLLEKQVEKVNAGILQLDQQILGIESSSVTVDIVNAMKEGKNAMADVMKQTNPDDIADLQDDIADLHSQQAEVDEVIASGVDMADDDDLEEELAQMEAEDLEGELDALPAVPTTKTKDQTASLPAAPTHEPAITDDDDAALQELEAEMAS